MRWVHSRAADVWFMKCQSKLACLDKSAESFGLHYKQAISNPDRQTMTLASLPRPPTSCKSLRLAFITAAGDSQREDDSNGVLGDRCKLYHAFWCVIYGDKYRDLMTSKEFLLLLMLTNRKQEAVSPLFGLEVPLIDPELTSRHQQLPRKTFQGTT